MDDFNKDSVDLFMSRIAQAKEEEAKVESHILNDASYMDNLMHKLNEESYALENNNKESSNDLSALYRIVKRYAADNEIGAVKIRNYDIYYLDYHGNVFSVFRKKMGKNMIYGCYTNYVDKSHLPYCINFEDIKNGRMFDFSRGLVAELKNIVDKLYNEGYPLYFIRQLVDNMIDTKENTNKK